MAERFVRLELDGGIATVTLDRPPRNALSLALIDQLVAALRQCGRDPEVRAVILTGAGDMFCAGVDLLDGAASIRTLVDDDGGDRPGYLEPAGRVTAVIDQLPVPVVAAINGDAAGGGATIPLAADLRFAAEGARFVFPFTRLGVCPEGASTYYLPRLVGPAVAADWLLSGRPVDSAEAHACGLVNRVVGADELLPAAREWCEQLAARTSATAVARTRTLLRSAPGTRAGASAAESSTIADLAHEPDCLEGVAAFLERRRPRFGGRPTVGAHRNSQGGTST